MIEDFEKLQEIGIQRIYEDTHISREHIIAVLEKDFKTLNKVQFLGFLSIFEREYKLELGEFKQEGLEFFSDQQSHLHTDSGVFIVNKSKKRHPLPYLVAAAIIVFGAAFFGFDFNSKSDIVEVQNVENEIILDVKKNLVSEVKEEETLALNNTLQTEVVQEDFSNTQKFITQKEPEVIAIEEKAIELQEFSINPKSRVWIGYIDKQENKKYQKTIKTKLALEKTKEWLVLLGHSHVNINATEKIGSFNTKGSLYLHYKDGVVEEISSKQFKKLNKGRKW